MYLINVEVFSDLPFNTAINTVLSKLRDRNGEDNDNMFQKM